jgi:NADPH:quinone reductase-like Zn-dependent oxidoreductase
VRELGAAEVMTNSEWEKASDSDAGGFDIILDATGGDSIKRGMRRLAPAGRVVTFGMSSIVTAPKRQLLRVIGGLLHTPFYTPMQLMNANKGIFGVNMLQLFAPPKPGEDPSRTGMGKIFGGILRGFEEKRFRVVVGKEFPLAEGGAAQAHLQSRANIGKVVLTS